MTRTDCQELNELARKGLRRYGMSTVQIVQDLRRDTKCSLRDALHALTVAKSVCCVCESTSYVYEDGQDCRCDDCFDGMAI